MHRQLQITYRGMEPSAVLDEKIEREVERLDRLSSWLIGVSVVIDAPSGHSRRGGLYAVGIDMRVAHGPPLHVGRPHHDEPGHEDVLVALRDAFAAARRRLQDYVEKRRADTKTHVVPPHGIVRWLDREQRFGFISSADGGEVYFHENALVDGDFDDIAPGDEVRFVVHAGEGAKGPQASTVQRIGKHHLPNVETTVS